MPLLDEVGVSRLLILRRKRKANQKLNHAYNEKH